MQGPQGYQFGDFVLRIDQSTLYRGERAVALTPKAFDVLRLLVEAGGRVVGKDELLAAVWADTAVEEGVLAVNISTLRKALGNGSSEPYIETIPRRGYRLLTPVRPLERSDATSSDPVTRLTESWRLATIAGAILVIGIVTAATLWKNSEVPSGAPGRVLLAVLPLESLGGESQQYLADGFTDELITEISRADSARLGVIARTSVVGYKHTTKPVRQIAGELNVDFVVEGTVRREGDRVHVTAQLIRTRDQTHVWTERFDRSATDMIAVQEEVARAVADEVQAKLAARPATRVPAEAQEALLRGRYHLQKPGSENAASAIEWFEKAVRLAPSYAPAHEALANAYISVATILVAPAASVPRGKAEALRALELDPSSAEAHTTLGRILLDYEWNWPAAEREFRRALELNPNLGSAHGSYANALSSAGRHREALQESRLALELDPISSGRRIETLGIYNAARQWDMTLALAGKFAELDPDSTPHGSISLAYLGKGDVANAAAAAAKTTNGNLYQAAAAAYVAAKTGHPEQARRLLHELNAQRPTRYLCPYSIAGIYVGLGEIDQAFVELERAYRDHST